MRKLLALLLALVMALGCMACFAGCSGNENTILDEAAAYLNNLYKDEAKSTPKDYDVAGKILIGTTEFTVTWKTDSDKITIKESKTAGFYTVDVPDENAKEFEYTLTATVKDAEGNSKEVSFVRSVPVLEKVVVDSTKKIVMQLTDTDKDGKAVTKYVTGIHYLYTSGSGSQKWELALTEDKAEALAMVMVENDNGTVSFVAEEKYLYCDATNVQFVDKAGENTEFVLETVAGGSFIKCANATYGEQKKPQYLEMYSGYLTCYGAPTDEAKNFMYTFTFADAGEAAGKISTSSGNTDPEKPGDPVTPPATLDAVTAPEAGVAYKLFMAQLNLGKNLFAIGDTQDQQNKYVLSTETAAEAVDFYAEAVDGGFKFYTEIDGAKMYLHAKHETSDGTKYSKYLGYAATSDVVWVYDAEINAWWTTIEGREYALGTYNSFATFCISDKSYITADNTGVSQFPGHLVLKENAENFVPETPEDPGTPETPTDPVEVTISEALALALNTKVIVSGTVTEINRPWSDDSGKISVYISDDAGNKILCYNMATKVEKGDIIKVTGEMGEYNGAKQVINCTAEITGKVTVAGPTEMTIPEALAAADGTGVIVTGTVVSADAWSDQYNNMSVTISDDDGNTLYVYRLATKVEKGDIIKVTGDMASYNESRQIAQGATAEIVGKATVDGPVEMSIVEALAAEDGTAVIVTGTVTKVNYAWSDSYGNMSVTISDDAGNTLYIYKLATKVGAGDVITVTGDMATYNGRQIGAGATAVIVTAHTCSTYSDATCTAAKACTVCGATEGEALGHNYVGGTCDRCGDPEPAAPSAGTQKADFDGFVIDGTNDTSYAAERTNADGWIANNARCDEQPDFGTDPQIILNGKTSAIGKLTSCTLSNGIKSLSLSYGNAFGESNGVSLKITIKNAAGEVVATTDLIDTDVTQKVAESFIWTLDTAVEGDFVIEITNNCPTNSTSNKDRVSIWNLTWENA